MAPALYALLVSLGSAGPALAQVCGQPPDMLIVQDRSGSLSTTNWNAAKNAINNLVSTYTGQIRFGLSLFPTSGSCGVSPPAVPVGPSTHAAIMSALNATSAAGGGTPIAAALKEANTYLKAVDPGYVKYVLLVTDGSENCGGDPVTETAALMAAGVKTYVVGFGSGVNTNQLNDMASAGGTAKSGTTKYYEATNQVDLNAALKAIAGNVSCCGNGVLDTGEKCDTKIASGAGKCPTACNDGNACTTDALTGKDCNVACSYTPITALISGDGCCPPGATSLTDSDCKVTCGNGVLEAGELCEPTIKTGAGKCPTLADCDDGNPCTLDTRTGTGCQVTCKHTTLTAKLAAKDGCCPPGATSLTDADCKTSCGNGLLESGELCDTKITAGTGKCPTLSDCDDGNACTLDTLSGGACTLKCAHAPVKASATAKDGCCPPGATSATDKDCKPYCGNGVLDTGELCDTKITAGAGKCKTKADCDDGDKCTTDQFLGSTCWVGCKNKPVNPSGAIKDGCCPTGHSSKTDADCPPPCGPDRTENCVDPCKDKSCPNGFCKDGKCIPWSSGGDGGGGAGGDGGGGAGGDSGLLSSADGAAGQEGGGNGGGNGAEFDGGEGCACQTSGSAGGPSLLVIGLLALLWVVRRRRAG
jgi:uncharacterized protein (TIGR03382 family)